MKSKHPLQLFEHFFNQQKQECNNSKGNRPIKNKKSAKQHQQQVCLTLFAVPHPSLFAVQVLSRKPILIVT